MKTKLIISQDDICGYCDEKCPNDIYTCPKLIDAINKKNAVYCWSWMKK